ncbi:ricin-type beta-trefoil lectin domain protein [Streptomyces capitiformicae]|uniref:ricin-type beta-trefoil lectin domain protein n=1 Tax=Streptomyces capitiformicae TaxID=2014920 RepID=UPI003570BE72
MQRCSGSANQAWSLYTDSTVRSMGKCFDAAGGGTAKGTKVHIWTCHGGAHQVRQPYKGGRAPEPVRGGRPPSRPAADGPCQERIRPGSGRYVVEAHHGAGCTVQLARGG